MRNAGGAPAQPRPLGYQPSLDALRALAIVPVVLFHEWLWPAGGYLGVDLFFVLSGFLITTLLIEERRRHGRISLSLFYLRRVLRLLPALYVMIGVVVALLVSSGLAHHRDLRGAVDGLTYTENIFDVGSGANYFSHLWSLGVEEQFYLVWPLLLIGALRVFPRGLLLPAGVALAALAVGVRLLVLPDEWALSMRFDSIFVGCAAALLYQRVPQIRLARRRLMLAVLTVLVLFFVVGRTDVAGRWTTPAFALVSAAAVLVVLDSRAVPAPLVFIGQISYALYLWHVPIYRIARDSSLIDTFGPDGIRVLALLGTFVAATVSYYVVEQPFLRQKWRLARTRSHDEPVAVEQPARPVPAEAVG